MFVDKQHSENIDDVTISTQRVQHQVAVCMAKADGFFRQEFRYPKVNFKQKGRAAGTAHLYKNELRFNFFMYQQDPSLFINTVVPHEVAHIIVHQIYGRHVKPHGKEWQAVMKKVYNLEPNRTHNFDVPPPKQAFTYQCQCQNHIFTQQRHNRVLKGTEYICKLCKSRLHFLSN